MQECFIMSVFDNLNTRFKIATVFPIFFDAMLYVAIENWV